MKSWINKLTGFKRVFTQLALFLFCGTVSIITLCENKHLSGGSSQSDACFFIIIRKTQEANLLPSHLRRFPYKGMEGRYPSVSLLELCYKRQRAIRDLFL